MMHFLTGELFLPSRTANQYLARFWFAVRDGKIGSPVRGLSGGARKSTFLLHKFFTDIVIILGIQLALWRIHCRVEVTESSTNKQHTLSTTHYASSY